MVVSRWAFGAAISYWLYLLTFAKPWLPVMRYIGAVILKDEHVRETEERLSFPDFGYYVRIAQVQGRDTWGTISFCDLSPISRGVCSKM